MEIADNITSLVENIKVLQKGDYLNVSEDIRDKVYYDYKRVIDILENIDKLKMKDFYNHF